MTTTTEFEPMTTETVAMLNGLLRGEISAVESYQQAIAKVGHSPKAADLQQLRDEHVQAANLLRQHVHHHGGTPDKSSGAWGAFAKAVEGTAKLFGNAAAVAALRQGEEHGISDYERALVDVRVPADCRELIQTQLLPQTRAHLATLDSLPTGG